MNTILSRDNLLSIFGGAIFVVIFLFGYSSLDANWYEYRDDGVITMSVAKNWVDYGFFGVSVSGPIVEATSSPMELFIYATVYAMGGISYDTYSFWQTLIATFILGAIFIRLFTDKPMFAIVYTLATSYSLIHFYHFFQWHASGMENALTHVLFLSTFYILYKSFKYEQIYYPLAIILFFATISRLDSVYHISMLLIIFSIFWYFVYHNLKAFYFSLLVFILWLLFNLWRYYYFGDLIPNTAYAQNISMLDRSTLLLNLDREYIRDSMNLGREIFLNHAGWLLLILPIVFFYTKRSIYLWFATLLVLSIVVTSYFNPFIFGATRLDHNRSTTQMILFVFIIIGLYFYHIKLYRVKLLFVVAILPLCLWYYMKLGYHPKPLCCNTKSFDKTRIKLQKIAHSNDIDIATVSNPDLGILSWHKLFNIVDIGRLGTPIMSHLKGEHELFKRYYLEYALPDIIELHDGWSCGYSFLLDDTKFKDLYKPLQTTISQWTINNCKDAPNSLSGIWIRRDIQKNSNSKERIFLDKLQKDLTLDNIERELDSCQKDKDSSCRYVARVLYHLLPQIIQDDIYQQVIDNKSINSMDSYSIYLLTSRYNALAYRDALLYIQIQ